MHIAKSSVTHQCMPHGNMINIRILPTDARNGLLQARREAIAIGFKFFPASNHLVLSVVVLQETSVAAVNEKHSCSMLVLGSYQRLPIVVDNQVRYYNLPVSIVSCYKLGSNSGWKKSKKRHCWASSAKMLRKWVR